MKQQWLAKEDAAGWPRILAIVIALIVSVPFVGSTSLGPHNPLALGFWYFMPANGCRF
jgi:hypothetical protein